MSPNLSSRCIAATIGRVLPFAAVVMLLFCAGASARAAIKLSVDVKDGDKISDVAKIRAHADSEDNIDKVEFYVDDQLRATANSVPYLFSWDTIADMEGPHTLGITAFDGNGQMLKITVMLTIDNEIALGGPALGQKALDALAVHKLDLARNFARRAIKAEPGNPEGSRVLAGIYAASDDWPHAISTLEKMTNLETSSAAMTDLARYRLRRALAPENAANLFTDLASIRDLRRKAGAMGVTETIKKHPGDTPADHEAIGDALVAAGKYHEASDEYAKSAMGTSATLSSISRYALANVLDNALVEAEAIVHPILHDKRDDPAIRAVEGLRLLRMRQFADARAIVQPDVAAGYPPALVIAAYADVPEGHTRIALEEALKAEELLPDAAESHYALSMALPKVTDQEDELGKALSFAPLQSAIYVDFGAREALNKEAGRFDKAEQFLDMVLADDPHDLNAQLTKLLVQFQNNQIGPATEALDKLSRSNKVAPDVLTAVATYYSLKKEPAATDRYLELARKQDEKHFAFSVAPSPLELIYALDRRMHYRAGFFLTPSSLNPPKKVIKAPVDPDAADAADATDAAKDPAAAKDAK